NIESLTASVNKLSLAVNDLEMENEELRERLGMDPRDRLDIEEIKQKRKVKKEQSAALNRVLVKEIDQLTGRNEELRHELTNARNETSKALVQVERRETKIEQLQEEVKALKEIGEGAVKLQALPLPEGMTPSSSEIIASLNEHLIYTLQ
ncbi:predicted protein, partial [Nematostella vectensis]